MLPGGVILVFILVGLAACAIVAVSSTESGKKDKDLCKDSKIILN